MFLAMAKCLEKKTLMQPLQLFFAFQSPFSESHGRHVGANLRIQTNLFWGGGVVVEESGSCGIVSETDTRPAAFHTRANATQLPLFSPLPPCPSNPATTPPRRGHNDFIDTRRPINLH